ncbi:MAG: stage II sporulation protein M, partial [Terricaulis silvestris]
SLFAFALGIAFCLPSVLLIAYNGATLGAMMQIFQAHGLGLQFTGWIFIHGVTELFAIIIAGAAGIRIGWALAFPGGLTRLQAAERAGRQGGVAMLGVVVMLFIAGLLEGFARQIIVEDVARFAVAATTGAIWLSYFYFPRGRSANGGAR